MTSFLRDLRQGMRQLVSRPAFSAAAIASLALGIGLNTTLFSVVNGVLLRDGPIARPDRLIEIYTGLTNDFPQLTTSYPDYVDIRQGTSALQGIAASAYVRGILSTGERPALVTGEVISSDYFDVLGIRLAGGRAFREDENAVPGSAPVVVLSHGLWQRQFGARAEVIGQPIELSGSTYTIVGVGPAGFTGTMPGIPTDFWAPIMMVDRFEFAGVQASSDEDPGRTRLERRGTRWLFLKGRLAEGRTIEEARAQIETIFGRLRTAYPVTNEKTTVSVLPASNIRFHPMLDGYVKAASAALLVAVSLVLLIACANVANMLLARGASRRRELAIRTAIGASRARIIRQLLSEGVVLAAAGGGLGVLIAWWAGRGLAGLGTTVLPIPVSFDFSLDGTVLTFALTASVATALLFGIAPAWSASKLELVPALKTSIEGDLRRRVTLSNILVVGQLALSLVLLVAGALLARGFLTARGANLGYDPRPVSLLSFNLQMNGYDLERSSAFRDRALKALRALPGVVAVSTASRLPLSPDINMDSILVQGHHTPGDDGTLVDAAAVGADYFKVVGVPILAGRAFTEDDIRQNRKVAIVNETLARQYWPDGSAVGRQIYSGSFTSTPFEIVGVARDHKVRSVGEDRRPYLHVPETPRTQLNVIARTVTPAAAALPMFRQALWALESNILFTDDSTAEQVAGTTVAPTRIGALVLGAFGALALLLAAVGLYGVVAHSVSRRTREVGIRIALGAERWQVVRMILGQGGRLALVGVALGVLAAAGVARALDSLLYGVSGFDPAAYGTAAGVLLLVTLGANLVPALAAARVDPIRALRNE
jgi:macrolide transport system ATP-binding/permease protein